MCNFRVGQKVVSVGLPDDFKNPRLVSKELANAVGARIPDRGRVYTVRAIFHFADGASIHLEEVCNRHLIGWRGSVLEPAFPAEGFRPVAERKTDISIFKAMLNTTPETAGAA